MADVAGISVSGPETADVVVMLHMSGVNRHMWDGVVPLLDDSLHCVTVDLPGFGDLAGEDFTVESATDRVGVVCDSLGVDRVALVGRLWVVTSPRRMPQQTQNVSLGY